MAPTFTDGSVPSASTLNAAIGPTIQTGLVAVTPTAANTPFSYPIRFPTPFAAAPRVQVTPRDAVGESVRGASVRQITTTGCTLVVYRTVASRVLLQWTAILPPDPIVAGQIVTAGHLNQGGPNGQVMQVGTVSITPTPNVLTPEDITFPMAFAAPPRVHTTALSGVPSVIRGTGATSITEKGATIWLERTSGNTTTVMWIAVGRL